MTRIVATKNNEQGWIALRARRDAALAASDWTQMPDVPLTAEKRAAWSTYRQELRDLTKAGHISRVIWPEPPKD